MYTDESLIAFCQRALQRSATSFFCNGFPAGSGRWQS